MPMESFVCLHVAEKPSLAKSIAQLLASGSDENGRLQTRKSERGQIDVHEFQRSFQNYENCLNMFTSVCGHVESIDFPDRYQDWNLRKSCLIVKS
jgi:DNA topoisomerase III